MSRIEHVSIAPSLLSADFGRLADAAREAENAGAEFLHFDVMDGHFVPNLTMGPSAVKALRPVSQAFFDVHLMIENPDAVVPMFAAAGANGLTVQAEACVHLQRTVTEIRKAGMKAGVALNPATPPDVLEYILEDIDLVLVMTVNPGFGGQKFLPAMLPKIALVREMIAGVDNPIHLEVDGGIAAETVGDVTEMGANVLVAGTAVYGHAGGVADGIRLLRGAPRRGVDL